MAREGVFWATLLMVALAAASTCCMASERYTVSLAGSYSVASIRNGPAEFVIGSAANGWTFDADYTGGNPWYYGYLYGNYNGCGWMLNNNLENTGDAGNDYCSSSGTVFPPTSFQSLVNSQPSNDGYPVNTICSTDVYGNVNPMGTTSPSDFLRTLPDNYQVLWRYVTLDGNWVMMRDPNVADGDGNWAFISRSCLPDPLPAATSPSLMGDFNSTIAF